MITIKQFVESCSLTFWINQTCKIPPNMRGSLYAQPPNMGLCTGSLQSYLVDLVMSEDSLATSNNRCGFRLKPKIGNSLWHCAPSSWVQFLS